MKNLVFLVTIGFFIGCSVAQRNQNSMNSEKIISMYRIKKIKNEKYYYIIYAVRNDSTFKIVSDTNITKTPDCKKNQVGKAYALDLKVVFPLDSLFGKPVTPNLGMKGIIKNNEVVKIEEKSHNKIYTSLNISGLCIK